MERGAKQIKKKKSETTQELLLPVNMAGRRLLLTRELRLSIILTNLPTRFRPSLHSSQADFDIIDHPPPPVFEAPVVSAPPITPVQQQPTRAAPPLTAEPPPPTFEQFLGNMSTEPIQATS